MTTRPAAAADAIRLSVDDNVATVLRAIGTGETVIVRCGDATAAVMAREAIPLCHKIAVAPLAAGARVVKYGQPIGAAEIAIPVGAHVHVHNMRSLRGMAER